METMVMLYKALADSHQFPDVHIYYPFFADAISQMRDQFAAEDPSNYALLTSSGYQGL